MGKTTTYWWFNSYWYSGIEHVGRITLNVSTESDVSYAIKTTVALKTNPAKFYYNYYEIKKSGDFSFIAIAMTCMRDLGHEVYRWV